MLVHHAGFSQPRFWGATVMLKNPTRYGNYRLVKGFPGYLIDDRGNLWSRFKPRKRRFLDCWRKINPSKTTFGHLQVTLIAGSAYGNGRRRQMLVHHLVLRSFGFKRPSRKHVTRHLNGDPSDNRLKNLKWGTHRDNYNDMVIHGTCRLKKS